MIVCCKSHDQAALKCRMAKSILKIDETKLIQLIVIFFALLLKGIETRGRLVVDKSSHQKLKDRPAK